MTRSDCAPLRLDERERETEREIEREIDRERECVSTNGI